MERSRRNGTGGESRPEERHGVPGLGNDVFRLANRLCDPKDTLAACTVAGGLLVLEALLSTAILLKVPYTKIDWDAYMSQVEGFLGGERDYTKLEGDTGPLVYPAGFLYIFSGLRWLTGGEVAKAQVLFLLFYLLTQAAVFSLYIRAKLVPPWALVLLCLSKRVHSIFILRLFNDCLAMALLYLSLALAQGNRWCLTLILFSAAVSVKMNVLLYAPPLLLLLLKSQTLWGTCAALACAAAVQVALGAPFLLVFPWEYISQAFNLGRVFIHFWSVNFKFVPETVFVSKPFALGLLALHLALLFLFAHLKWSKCDGGAFGVLASCVRRTFSRGNNQRKIILPPDYVLAVMMTGNFIGIVCARSLHYQFYSWYFHSLPLLLWLSPYPTAVRVLLFFVVEACWNIYPSTSGSSIVLLVAHFVILLGLALGKQPSAVQGSKSSKLD